MWGACVGLEGTGHKGASGRPHRMCPVAVERLWELSRLDRMLPLLRPVVIELTRPVVNGTSLEAIGLDRGASGLGTVLRLVAT